MTKYAILIKGYDIYRTERTIEATSFQSVCILASIELQALQKCTIEQLRIVGIVEETCTLAFYD